MLTEKCVQISYFVAKIKIFKIKRRDIQYETLSRSTKCTVKKLMLRGLDLKYRIFERKTFTNDELHMYGL